MSRLDHDNLDLLVLGVHLNHESYPNVMFRIKDLKEYPGLVVREINVPMWTPITQSKHGKQRLFRNPFRGIGAHLLVLYYYIRQKYRTNVYIPYPGVPLLFLISLLPRRLRPSNIIIDSFISLYDTIVVDRQMFGHHSMIGKLVFFLEKRSLLHADSIIVDTEQSRYYVAKLFDIPIERLHALPLSTDESSYTQVPYSYRGAVCRVLFIGTLIPLHGIDVIVGAMKRLRSNRNIEFHIIGDGQDAKYLEEYQQAGASNMKWDREWKNSKALAEEIGKADICLGIFGVTGKASRVCPFKIYSYSNVGRAIVTARTAWTESIEAGGSEYFCLTRPGSVSDLAHKINVLMSAPELQVTMAKNSARFYQEYLFNCGAIEAFLLKTGIVES